MSSVALSRFVFTVVLAILTPALPAICQTTLITDGQARAEIVIASQPTRSAEFGAAELRSFLEKITGCRLDIITEPRDEFPVKIYVGESEAARGHTGVTAAGLPRDAFRMTSGPDWLTLVGNDKEFEPIEPWAQSRSQWLSVKEAEWTKLVGHPWRNPVGSRLYRDYNRELDFWNFDHRGSLNAVYAFLRELGVRWYMPGELGEVVPEHDTIALPDIDRTVRPEYEVRSISRPLISSQVLDDALWYLRIGANEQYGVLHHGQRYLTEHPEQRAAHPEYYAMKANGERDNESATANACLSSEGFFRETVAFSRFLFDHYEVPIVSVMPHDGFSHCQCDDCRDQVTLERGPSGQSSDYVWDFVVRVAKELASTHPDRKVFSGAYSSYRLPPLTIDKLPPNVLVQITNGRPIRDLDDEVHAATTALRAQWQKKTDNPLSVTLNYTPLTNRGGYRPQYWPHVIARGMQDSHEDVWREDVWLSSGKGGLHHPAMAHLNPWVISRFWWNADEDIDALLGEYYDLFYGPAAKEMKAFIEFCETNYASLGSDSEIAKEALERFNLASAAAPANSVYGERIALVDAFLVTLRARSSQMQLSRPEGLPDYRIIDMAKDKWRDARDTLVMDGRLEEAFWTAYPYPRPLGSLRESSAKPKLKTRFMARWWNGSLYFGIRCELPEGESPVIGTDKDEDPALWQGEHLELLIETDKHSYYQLVLNPAGAIIDLDRAVDRNQAYDWSSQAEVATHLGEDFWSVELRLPVTPSDEDPLHALVGSRPFQSKADALASGKGTSLPWHFNLFRKRAGSEDGEASAFSPLGETSKNFHDLQRFSRFYVQ
ncbi:MAG: DUF4838 domain-containing protein [Verrucomicrobiales bacterium]|nr:DUF4838 domain-containing protein [Verrucomicrobiales bacterium]